MSEVYIDRNDIWKQRRYYRDECVFCCVDHDMGATIPTCMYDPDYEYGKCSCYGCGHFVNLATARSIVRDRLESLLPVLDKGRREEKFKPAEEYIKYYDDHHKFGCEPTPEEVESFRACLLVAKGLMEGSNGKI